MRRPSQARQRPRSPVAPTDFTIGAMLGAIYCAFPLSDLTLRPAFIPVGVNSDVFEHAASPAVGAAHMLVNLVVVVPVVVGAWRRSLDFRRVPALAALFLAILLVATLSLFAHAQSRPIAQLLLLAYTMAAALLLAATRFPDHEARRGLFVAVAVGCALILLGAIARNEYNWGRLSSRAGPNYWGSVSVMAFAGSFSLRRWWGRVAIWGIVAAILALTSARGSMIAVFAGAAVAVAILNRRANGRRLALLISAGLAVLAVAPFVLDRILHLSDPSRGLDSGATGRALAWKQAWQLFLDNPLLGIGFRRHTEYITVATSAHSAYLSTIAEMGATGMALYLLLVLGGAGWALVAALRDPRPANVSVATFLFAFIAIGFFETQALTTGAPLALMMFSVVAFAWEGRGAPRRRPRTFR